MDPQTPATGTAAAQTPPVTAAAADPAAPQSAVGDATGSNVAGVTLHLSAEEAAKLKEQLATGTVVAMAEESAPLAGAGPGNQLPDVDGHSPAPRQTIASDQTPKSPLPPGVYQETISVPIAVSSGYCPTSIDISLTGEEAKMLCDLAAGLRAAGELKDTHHPREAIRWLLRQMID